MVDTIAAIKSCRLFMGLPDENIEEIGSIAIRRKFMAGELISLMEMMARAFTSS